MAQQNIDFGAFPDDPSADAIRTAFQKVQNNFTQLFDINASAPVTSINRTSGAGITVNSSVGNVVVSANISNVTVSSPNLIFGTSLGALSNSVVYTSSSQTLYIVVPNTFSIGNLVASGYANITGNLSVNGNATLGNAVTANYFIGSGNTLSNIQGANITGPVASANTAGTVTTAAQPNITSVGTLSSLVVSGNIASGNANLGNAATANYFIGNAANLFDIVGANVTGTVANANYSVYAGNVVGASQPNITSLGTLSSLSVSGNANVGNLGTAGLITATGNIQGGNLVTGGIVTATGNIQGGNLVTGGEVTSTGNVTGGNLVTGGVINATGNANVGNLGTTGVYASTLSATGNANVGNIGATNGVFTNISGEITTASQPNITSTGTLSSLSVSGNANIGNIGTGGLITATGNITGGNLVTPGNLSVTGTATLGNLTVTGNLSAGNIVVDAIVNGNSHVDITNPNGNITMAVDGNANVFIATTTGILVNGTVNANQFISNIATGNAPFIVTSTTQVANLSVATAGSSNTAGTVTTAAQPNITSLGTLTGLTSNGTVNFTNASNVSLGSNSIVRITGGNSGQTLTTDGTGSLSWTTFAGAPITTSNTQVLFDDTGSIVGNANLTFDKTAQRLSTVNFSASGNANTGNLGASGTIIASGNINGANLGTGGLITASGNIQGGNLITTGVISATGNVTAGNVNATRGAFTNISGEGGNISNIQGANITGTVANSTVASTVDVTNTNGLTTTYYPTFVENRTTGQTVRADVDLTYRTDTNTLTTANLSATGNVIGALLTGTLTTTSQPNITSLGTLTSASISGNVSAGNINGGNLAFANYIVANSEVRIGDVAGDNWARIRQVPNSTAYGFTADSGPITVITNEELTLHQAIILGDTNNDSNNDLFGVSVYTGNGSPSTGNEAWSKVLQLTGTGNLIVTGNITANGIAGNGNQLNNIAGANVTGTVANANYASFANVVVANAQPNITSVGTLTGLSVNGTITAVNLTANTGIFTGNGAGLTNIPGANITGNITGNISNAAHAVTANTVVDAAQPNITSVGTLTSLSVSGNANVGNINGTGAVFSTITGTLTTNSQPNITSVGTLSSLNVTGKVTAGQLQGDGGNISNIQGANVSGAVLTATTAVTVTANSQPNITSVGTLTTLSVTGNVSANNFTGANLVSANFITGTLTTADQPNITSLGTLVNASVTGNVIAGNVYANSGTVGANQLIGNLTTAAQPNITSLGTLTSLSVSGNITGGNLNTAGKVVASTLESNVATGTAPFVVQSTTKVANLNADFLNSLTTANAATATTVVARDANASFSANIITATLNGAATTSGTVTTAAQPNITSVGTLTSLSVTGNVIAGNVYSNSGTIGASLLTGTLTTAAQPNITSLGTLSSLSVTGNVAAGNLTTTGILNVIGTGVSSIAGNLDMTSNTIINLATPTNPNDAATKQYVDDIAQGLHTHDSCNAATPDTLANITGGTITYNNGSSGVGANLTTTGTFNLIDGVNVQTAGTRILVKNEANSAHNGIYTWSNATVITRATDFDTPSEMAGGDFTFVNGGTLYDNTGWVMTDPVTTVGTSPVPWVQFSGAGTYQAGTGLTLTGSIFSVNASQTQITSVGTLSGLNVNGTVTASAFTANTGIFTGNGSGLTNLNASNISSGTLAQARLANSSLTVNGTSISLGGSGTITANVTQSLSNGNYITGGSFNGGTAVTWAVDATNAATANKVVARDANASFAGNVITATTFAGSGANITTINASNISSGTLAQARLANSSLTINGQTISLGGSGTVTSNTTQTLTLGTYLTGTSFNGGTAVTTAVDATTTNTANKVVARDANGSFSANIITANLTGNATTAGTVITAAQPNITSVGTLTSLSVSGNITAANIIGIFANGNSNVSIPSANGNVNISAGGSANELVVTSTGVYVNGTLDVTGNTVFSASGFVHIGGDLGGPTFKTFGNLEAAGNASFTGSNVSLGNIGNVKITGGSNGQVITTNGSGTLSFSTLSLNTISNGNSNVNIPSANGNVNISAVGNANILVVTGTGVNVAGTFNATGNANVGNLGLARLLATGNITAPQLVSNVATGTAPLAISSTTLVANLNADLLDGYNTATAATANTVVVRDSNGNITGNNISGTLSTATQQNITSLGTLGSLTVTGNVTSGNVYANTGTIGASLLIGTLVTATQPNITSLGTLSSLAVTGNITSGNVYANSGTIGASLLTGTLTTAAQPNITSVGTLTSLSSSGNVTGANIIATAYHIRSVGTGISANGSTQATATTLSKEINIVSTVSSGQGVKLPTAVAGMVIIVVNRSANTLLVYPDTNGIINSQAANAAYSLPTLGSLQFISSSTTQWYTVGASYA